MEERFRGGYQSVKIGRITYYYATIDFAEEPYQAVYGCDGGNKAEVPPAIAGIPVREVCTSEDFMGKGFESRKVILPQGLRSVRQQAFYENPHITELELPDSVEIVGWRSFAFCPHLTRLSMPFKNLITLPVAFKGTTGIKKIHLSDWKKTMKPTTFWGVVLSAYDIMCRARRGEHLTTEEEKALEAHKRLGWYDYAHEYSDDFDTLFRGML